jgi:hypothetical protein
MTAMKKLLIVALLLAAPAPARAEVGIGAFFGAPFGNDLKLDIARRQAFDLVFGWTSLRREFADEYGHYGHFTYLVTPFWGYGSSINVPIRLGIGLALYDHGPFVDEVNVAARFPLEIGMRFHSVPLELYGEIAIKITFVDPNHNDPDVDLDGGIGLRFYF